MTNDEKKVFLDSYRRSLEDENKINEQILKLKLRKLCPSSLMDGMPRAKKQSDLSDYAARISELEESLQEQKEQSKQLQDYLQAVFNLQIKNPVHRQIMSMRYLQCKKWNEIQDELSYTREGVFTAHRRVIDKLEL